MSVPTNASGRRSRADLSPAGPSTGVPTKTEQGDLNQAFGASQGDYPRVIIAPLSVPDCFRAPALAFNLADRYQCPVIILTDLLTAEGTETVDPAEMNVDFEIDRGVAGRVDVLKLKGEKQCQIKKTTEYSHVRALVN